MSGRSLASVFSRRAKKVGLGSNELFAFARAASLNIPEGSSQREELENIITNSDGFQTISELDNSEVLKLNDFLSDRLQVDILGRSYRTGLQGVTRFLRQGLMIAAAAAMTVFLLYLILSGKSTSPIWSEQPLNLIGLLGFSMICLALLEGTQISIASLRLKDLDAKTESVSGQSRVFSLHAKHRTEEQVKNYFAGRQLLTVVCVFFISRVTSFDLQYEPISSIQPINSLVNFADLLFLKLGILGALTTLWYAQLVPQFYATKRPLALMSWPGAALIVRLCHWVEATGITSISHFITDRVENEATIPTSTRERFQSFGVNHGYLSERISHTWKISDDGLTYKRDQEFHITRSGIPRLKIYEEWPSASTGTASFTLTRADTSVDLKTEASVEYSFGNRTGRDFSIRPTHHAFVSGDVLLHEMEFKQELMTEPVFQANIRRPTRYLVFSIVAKKSVPIGVPLLIVTDDEHQNIYQDFTETYQFWKIDEDQDTTTFGCLVAFPNPDHTYEVKWEALS